MLQSYDWPGNIREFQNLIERAVITSDRRRCASDRQTLIVRREVAPPEESKTLVA
jgi:transcriptional regulator with AAA-type ATPase domain